MRPHGRAVLLAGPEHEVEEAVVEGPLVMPLSQAVEEHGDLVDRYLGSVVPVEDDPFVARNAAEWEGGLFVYVPRNTKLDAPVVASAIQPRTRKKPTLWPEAVSSMANAPEASSTENHAATIPPIRMPAWPPIARRAG